MLGSVTIIRHPQASMRCIGSGASGTVSSSPSIPANALLTEGGNELTAEDGDSLTDETDP